MPPKVAIKGGGDTIISAYDRLRRALIQGHVSEAETVGAVIREMLEASKDLLGGDADLALAVLKESMNACIGGISAILAGDNQTGIKRLTRLTRTQSVNPSLLWVAWQWIALAARGAGNIERAHKAATAAMELSERLDDRARSTSLSTLGEIRALQGRTEEALGHLETAQELFKDLDDRRGMASVLMVQSRIMAGSGQVADSLFAANLAQALDPKWVKPTLFLANKALIEADLKRADELLTTLDRWDPRPPEADRVRILLELARGDEVPVWLIREYLHLREALPNEETVGKLEAFAAYRPAFLHLVEELAWKLLRLGRYDEASEHFNHMARQQLDPDMHASVLLGLGCLATVQQRHRQPAARVRAAVSAFPASMKEKPRKDQPAPQEPPPQEPEARTPPTEETPQLGIEDTIPLRPFHEDLERSSRSDTKQHPPVQVPPDSQADRPRKDSEKLHKVEDVAGREAVFSGALQTLSVADVLDFLGQGRRTGTLIVSSTDGIGAIHLRQGRIAGAASPDCDNIGHLLVSRGDITEEQLDAATTAQESSPDRLLGAIIVEQKVVEPEVMQRALTEQVFAAIQELFIWNEGQFSFTPDMADSEVSSEIEVQLDTQFVLLEVARRVDEKNAAG